MLTAKKDLIKVSKDFIFNTADGGDFIWKIEKWKFSFFHFMMKIFILINYFISVFFWHLLRKTHGLQLCHAKLLILIDIITSIGLKVIIKRILWIFSNRIYPHPPKKRSSVTHFYSKKLPLYIWEFTALHSFCMTLCGSDFSVL